MKHSTDLVTVKTRIWIICGAFVISALFFISLFVGKYPLKMEELIAGNELQWQVFWTLRFSRSLMGCLGGFLLGISGYVFQIVFRNSLASPDVIGVSSGASAGAAAGILFFSGGIAIIISSFAGAVLAVVLALCLASIEKSGKKSTIVIAGIAVHSLAQTLLMFLKITADPEKELASIEYWIMGSLNAIKLSSIRTNLIIGMLCALVLIFLHRQILLLSTDEAEAKMLGANVLTLRVILLGVATFCVASVISLTGLISFVGLLAPCIARKLFQGNNVKTMIFSGMWGSSILIMADIFARAVAQTELPVSIFTSLIGAPFLILLIMKERQSL